jgi:methylenetetrahydrofolate dehydrogenase (NADP+)/methenyltetrahydrofolate cyclohydrolase
MLILNGVKLKEEIAIDLKKKIFKIKGEIKPKLVIIQIGDDCSSDIYVEQKIIFAQKIGAVVELIKFPQQTKQQKIISVIRQKNKDFKTHGIIVQLPIPNSLDKTTILNSINAEKDVDGLSDFNVAKLVRDDKTGIIPATARGIINLLKGYDIDIAGKNIVILGRSLLVGKTTALTLINLDSTVTICHSKTKELSKITKKADIIISAVGQPGIINDKMISQKQIVIDVGITRISKNQISGDVALKKNILKAVSPVPGGVGQMTVASLFQNLFESFEKQTPFSV